MVSARVAPAVAAANDAAAVLGAIWSFAVRWFGRERSEQRSNPVAQ
jgi:hypothetical protein